MSVDARQDSATRPPLDRDVARFVGLRRHEDGLTVAEVAQFAGAEIAVTFAARLKFAREREGRSKEECAKVCGYSRQAIANWEDGQSPNRLSADALERLAKFLHVTAEWLEHGTGLDVTEAAGGASTPITGDLKPLLEDLREAEDTLRKVIRKVEKLTGL